MKNSSQSPIIIILVILILIAAVAGVYGIIQLGIWVLYVIFFYPLHMLIALSITAISIYAINRIKIRLSEK